MTDKARILFVDDEKRVLNAMRGLFRRDYELFLTTEGAEAVRIAAENEIDVIVADQRMPGMTGIEVLGKIKEQSPRTVRILLTGYADPSAVEGSINIGEVFRFLSKPCPPQMLRETLGLAISASRSNPVPAPAAQARPAAAPAAPVAAPQATTAAAAQAPATPQPPPTAAAQAPPAPPQPQPTATAPAADPAPAPATATSETKTDDDATEPAIPALDEEAVRKSAAQTSSHWQSVTNVVLSEDSIEETHEDPTTSSPIPGFDDVGVVIFTVESEFAATAVRAVSTERSTIIATTLVKVAQAIKEKNAGVLVTDFTTNNTTLQKMIGALKQHLPELVTIVVSSNRDTTDMINLINYGQVFRYVLKPIEPEQLRTDINAAAIRHLYLLNNPDSVSRHEVVKTADTSDESTTLNRILGKIRERRQHHNDPTDTIS